MTGLILTISIVIVIFLLKGQAPFLAGFIAVIPVKIIGTFLMTKNDAGWMNPDAMEAVRGMLIGQFVIGFILLGIYLFYKYGVEK